MTCHLETLKRTRVIRWRTAGQTQNSLSTIDHIMDSKADAVLLAGDLSYADCELPRWVLSGCSAAAAATPCPSAALDSEPIGSTSRCSYQPPVCPRLPGGTPGAAWSSPCSQRSR